MTNVQRWTTPEWRADIDGWIVDQLAGQGIRVTGAIEQPYLCPWATVLLAQTTDRPVYCKAAMIGLDHEPRLTAMLASWRPDLMPDILAIDDACGWMLSRDAGPMLATITASDTPDLTPWLDILARYAELQIEMIPRIDDLLAVGVFDHRLETLTDQLIVMLDDEEAIRTGPPDGLNDEEIVSLRDSVSRVSERCAELAGYGIPDTLHHDDLHPGNIFIGGGRVTIADWAETCVAHPFFTMRMTLLWSAHFAGLPNDAPSILKMRDAFLEPWTSFASRDDVSRAYQLSERLAILSHARVWHRVIVALTGEERRQHAGIVPKNLRRFLAVIDV